MALRTTLQLQTDFPNGTTAQCASSLKILDQLVRDGFLGDNLGEVKQIQDWVASYTDTLGETFTPAVAVVGSAGTTLRTYAVRPRYPLPMGSPGNMAALYSGDLAANYENEAPGKPPQGRPNPLAFLADTNVQDNRTTLIGKAPTSFADLLTTPATLTLTDYASITVPAIGLVPNTTFDVLVQEGETSEATLFGITGTVTTSDSVVVTGHTAKGATAFGPFTYVCTAAETAAQILAGVLAMLNAQAVAPNPLVGWKFRSSGLYLIATAPAADTSGDNLTLVPTASTHVLLNGANATTGAIAIAPAPVFTGIAFNVAPSAVIQDNGTLVRMPYDQLGEYPHSEVWVDTSLNPIFAFTVGTTTVNDFVTLTFLTKGGAGTFSLTYNATASETAAQIATALLALVNAQIGVGLPLQGWAASIPTAGSLQFVSPDPQPDENNGQGGNLYGDSVTVDLTASENITVNTTFVTTKFTVGITGTVATPDSIVATIAYAGGTLTQTITVLGTASETAAQLATALAAAVEAEAATSASPLYGWSAKVFNAVDVLFSSPQASGNTVKLDPTAGTHILINGSNAATSATAVANALDTKAVGPLLLERFSRVNVYESPGGAPNTLQQGGAQYVGPLT